MHAKRLEVKICIIVEVEHVTAPKGGITERVNNGW
jgi:hypothetical protein